jgi:hypothetical protein
MIGRDKHWGRDVGRPSKFRIGAACAAVLNSTHILRLKLKVIFAPRVGQSIIKTVNHPARLGPLASLPTVNRRPKLTIVAPNASAEEAAAVVAALERFMRETAPPQAPQAPAPNPWQQAALSEGVMRHPQTPLPWH